MVKDENDFERRKEIIKSMNIMDDDFFAKIAEDIGAMEEILCTLLQKRIRLCWTRAQIHLRNCGTRSVTLDALCKSEKKVLYGIEMEKSNKHDHQRRVRYNRSNIDTACAEKGINFRDIPEICMIYISKSDFFKRGFTVYHVNRILQESGEVLDNGVKEIYVNTRVDDGSKIAQLMNYMKHTRGGHPLFPRLSARVKYLKEERKGVDEMCEAVERYAREKAKEAARQAAREYATRLFQNGVSFEVVVKSITGLKRKELERIYQRSTSV